MLKQLHLKNWRSLRDVTIDFTPITVFIGANSSGKTNIIDALKFRRDSTRNGGRQAISKWKVLTDILPYSTDERNIEIQLDYYYPYRKLSYRSLFKLDTANISSAETPLYVNDKKLYEGISLLSQSYPEAEKKDDQLNYIFRSLIINRIQILDEGFSPNVYQSRNLDQPLDLIDGKAGNVLAILDYMRQVAPTVYEAFSENMSEVLEHVDRINVHNEGQEFKLVITERQLTALTVSAGTARVVAILTALHMLDIPPDQNELSYPRGLGDEMPSPDPGLVIIEEPDAVLNPGVLENLVNVMRRFTEGDKPRQIILTTHNPTFLNYFKPEEVRVVERDEEGITQVYPVPHDILEGLETIDTLGDVWLTRALGGIGG